MSKQQNPGTAGEFERAVKVLLFSKDHESRRPTAPTRKPIPPEAPIEDMYLKRTLVDILQALRDIEGRLTRLESNK